MSNFRGSAGARVASHAPQSSSPWKDKSDLIQEDGLRIHGDLREKRRWKEPKQLVKDEISKKGL